MREASTALAVSTIMLRALPFSNRTSLAPPTTSCNLLACSSTRRRRVFDSKPIACSRTTLAPWPRAKPAANSTSASESGRPSLAIRMRRANSPGDVERATSKGVVNELSAVTATPFLKMAPNQPVLGAPSASRSRLNAQSRTTCEGGASGSTSTVAETPAARVISSARSSTSLTSSGPIAAPL